MTTEQIIGNLIFMKGYREVYIWETGATYTLPDLSVNDIFGDCYPSFKELVNTLAVVRGVNEYVSIVHRPTKGSVPRAYLFLGGADEWLPIDRETTEEQMQGWVKCFRAEIMTPSDFG